MNQSSVPSRAPQPLVLCEEAPDERLSALVDGEITTGELDTLLPLLERDVQWQASCQHYHLIGDLLRGGAPLRSAAPDQFVTAVRARLQVDGLQAVPVEPLRAQKPAANDAVFRWKLVAGLASVAAVMAVSWTVLGVAPGTQTTTVGPQVAQLTPAMPTPVAVDPVAAQAVVVNTAQGPVIRDARLEELLAEHRQFGGMSALQMPAGFLRDATYQSPPQR